jgi:hypothetical protein
VFDHFRRLIITNTLEMLDYSLCEIFETIVP